MFFICIGYEEFFCVLIFKKSLLYYFVTKKQNAYEMLDLSQRN